MVLEGKEHASLCAKVVSWFKLVHASASIISSSMSSLIQIAHPAVGLIY